jgi:hypothetical protein
MPMPADSKASRNAVPQGLFAAANPRLGFALVRHVELGAQQAGRPAGDVLLHDPVAADVPGIAIGATDAEFGVEPAWNAQRGMQFGLEAVRIFRVEHGVPVPTGGAKVDPGSRVDLQRPVVPLQTVIGDVPVPDADARGLGGEVQAF